MKTNPRLKATITPPFTGIFRTSPANIIFYAFKILQIIELVLNSSMHRLDITIAVLAYQSFVWLKHGYRPLLYTVKE